MNLQTINASASPEVQMNENFETLEHQAVYGKRHPVTTGLTWGYCGGRWGGFSVADGVLTLTDASTNYIVVAIASGVASVASTSTNWNNTTDYVRVYKITTAGGVVTAVEDHRAGPGGVHGGAGGGGGGSTVTSWKTVVRAASTANGTLATAFENGDTLDGVTLVTGDRILLKNQTTASENGIYTVNASGAPTRATDADTGAELVNATVPVSEGTANADTIWMCSTNGPITLGSTSLTFAAFAAGSAVWGGITGTLSSQSDLAAALALKQPRSPSIQTVSSSATVTPTFADDMVIITAQAAGLTLANPTGTAIDGLGIVIRIKDNGTARSITFGSQYRAIGVTLPSSTTISKTLYLAMIFNNADTKWDVVAVGQDA